MEGCNVGTFTEEKDAIDKDWEESHDRTEPRNFFEKLHDLLKEHDAEISWCEDGELTVSGEFLTHQRRHEMEWFGGTINAETLERFVEK